MRSRDWLFPLVMAFCATLPAAAGAQVLRVGSFRGVPGQFASIQAAVSAARPGDVVLIGPGDYKTDPGAITAPAGHPEFPAGVLITTPGLRLRGMDRNAVVVDGTKPGTPRCSTAPSAQNFGPAGPGGAGPTGLNGILVWKADQVSVENLTACNFLGGSGEAGNEIWWNGGAGSGQIGGHGYYGAYLSATSTFYQDESSAAQYGIFSSNWTGGTWDQVYASNFNDSGFYIGACQQICDQTMNHAWSQYNALGYSGTNSGGYLVIQNSQFDHNEDGFDTNSQNADFPPPQDGACPNNGISPITHTHSCWVFRNNYVHDSNNPNVPAAGSAAAGPVGTGMSVSGARDDTVMNNTFANNGAWGLIVVPYPDSNTQPCTGGTQAQGLCVYDEYGDAVLNNRFIHNGFFGNSTNGDIGFANTEPGPTSCFQGNSDPAGLTTSPAGLESSYPACTGQTVAPNPNPLFVQQVACDSESIQLAVLTGGQTCPPVGASYPRHGAGQPMPGLPSGLPSMARPCSGVSTDPWCSGQVFRVRGCASARPRTVMKLAVLESFRSVTTRIGRRRAVTHRARGRQAVVRVNLRGYRHRLVRVRYTENIRVHGHREHAVFTRIFQRC
ncbi:MAG TPA: hypothetical protein VF781_01250 [Solirubrobacteraceae bacterium]